MKKILTAALVLVSFVNFAFASDDDKLKSWIVNDFKTKYVNASNVTYTFTSKFTKVNFEIKCDKYSAFYSPSNEYIGTSQDISFEELPLNAKKRFSKAYKGYTVKGTIKFESPEETAYYICAEKEGRIKTIKCTNGGWLSVLWGDNFISSL